MVAIKPFRATREQKLGIIIENWLNSGIYVNFSGVGFCSWNIFIDIIINPKFL